MKRMVVIIIMISLLAVGADAWAQSKAVTVGPLGIRSNHL